MIDTSSNPIKKQMTFGNFSLPLQREVSHRSDGVQPGFSNKEAEKHSIFHCECSVKIPVRALTSKETITEHNKRCQKMQQKFGEPMLALESLLNPELGAKEDPQIIDNLEAIITFLEQKVSDEIHLQKRPNQEAVGD